MPETKNQDRAEKFWASSIKGELHRVLFEEAADGLFISDLQGRFVTVNPRGMAMTGYSPEELVGMTITDLIPPEDLARDPLRMDDFRQGQHLVKERRIRRKDDSLLPVEISARLLPGKKVLGIVRDLTEHKQAEETVQAQENLLSSVFRAAPTGIGVVSNRILLAVNDRLCEMIGYRQEELVGKSARVLYSSDADFEYVGKEKYRQIGERGTGTVETRWQCKNGRIIDVLLSSTPINPMDMVGGVTFTALDITERKRMENSLRMFQCSIDQAFDAVFWINSDGGFSYVNDKACWSLGYTRDELLHLKLWDIDPVYPKDLWASNWENYQINRQGGGELLETLHRHKDGTTFPVEVISKHLWFGDEELHIAVVRDITERQRAAKEKEKLQVQLIQAQKMESVARLAGGVAHDFNNMLSAILGHTELAMMQCTTSESVQADLEAIKKASHRSADLIRQLLAFARKQTVAPKVLDLNDTLAGMLKMLQRLIGEDIDLVWKPGAGLWPIKMDSSQIDQLLANLCVNARDAIDEVGKMTIETENIAFDEDYCAVHPGFVLGEYVMLAVSDDGCGMDQKVLELIFDPFFTTKEVGKGTGLGLATVYGIVKQNEGFINVYSEPGKGTTFKIYLPRQQGESLGPLAEITKETPKGRGELVLLVEDEAMILDVGRVMLERLGYRVVTAGTPGEALRQASAYGDEIQLLITDVIMPEMNGRDLAKLLCDLNSGLKCLFTSGYTANVIAHRGVLDEGVNFLQKPFSMQDLGAKVRRTLDGK
jgi:two-component system, cell cycle sensor histidine kinase and response regulator CckA